MRTPLTSILGFLELMKSPHCRAEEKEKYLQIIQRSSTQMLSLIDDILDLAKVEAGEVINERIPFSLTELLSEVNLKKSSRATEVGIQFRFKSNTAIPDRILSDRNKLRQILLNLLDNAIKFTEKGEVDFSVSYTDKVLEFCVADTGIGISSEQQTQLFRVFSQVDTSLTRQFGGTGLGLVLSRALSEALGGRLDLVESKQGSGSTFRVQIPAALPEDAKLVAVEGLAWLGKSQLKVEDPLPGKKLTGLNVLLVEDSADIQLLVTQFLLYEGATVRLAKDGEQGVRMALAEDFDIVLMDIQMPILDGHEATIKLRQWNYQKPIIALTAHAMKTEQEKCLRSGFSDFLTKPINRQVLTNTLLRNQSNYTLNQ